MKNFCYELGLIFSPRIEDNKEYHIGSTRNLLKRLGSEIVGEEDWGLKDFAYPIKKYRHGFYYFFSFQADSSVPQEVRSELKLNEYVIRHLLVKQPADENGLPITMKKIRSDEEARVEATEEKAAPVKTSKEEASAETSEPKAPASVPAEKKEAEPKSEQNEKENE